MSIYPDTSGPKFMTNHVLPAEVMRRQGHQSNYDSGSRMAQFIGKIINTIADRADE